MNRARTYLIFLSIALLATGALYLLMWAIPAPGAVAGIAAISLASVMIGAVLGYIVALIKEVFTDISVWRSQKRRAEIRKLPGMGLLRFVDFFFSPKTVEQTFKPTVADWHLEYIEALSQKRSWKARWINVRYTYQFLKAMGLSKALEAIKELMKAFK
jgi:hypothetical protein